LSVREEKQLSQQRVFTLLAALVFLSVGVLEMTAPRAALSAEGAAGQGGSSQTSLQRLEGRWVRLDGGYTLELSEIRKDGVLTAHYANPIRQVKVHSSKWSRKAGQLHVFVELRDINYPGSKYSLHYDALSDRLIGTYYQAVEGQTYDIEFVRTR
jgi:hypothetical protein